MQSSFEELAHDLAVAQAAEIGLRLRLASAIGASIRVWVAPSLEVEGALLQVSADHLWLADVHGYWVVALAHVDAVSEAPPMAATAPVAATGPGGLASALRGLVGDDRRTGVFVGGRWWEGALRRVGSDFVELDAVLVPLRGVRACRVWY